MRFRITLRINRQYGDCLPFNYQYELSAAIYKILKGADAEYAAWLHGNGFQLESGKRFKLFCYSRLQFERYRIMEKAGCIQIVGDRVEWMVSFLPEKSTLEFVKGLFLKQHLTVGNKDYRVAFEVVGVEALPPVSWATDMEFSANSPICIRQRIDGRTQYLSPEDAHYGEGILQGLLSKYESFKGHPFEGEVSSFRFTLLTARPKPKLITIKAGTPEQTKVKGYLFRFRLQAPIELMKLAYEGGVGEECSQGFGFIE